MMNTMHQLLLAQQEMDWVDLLLYAASGATFVIFAVAVLLLKRDAAKRDKPGNADKPHNGE